MFLSGAAWARLHSSLSLFSRVSDIPDAAAIIMIIIIVIIFSRTEATVLKPPRYWAAAALLWERPASKYWIGAPNTNPLQTHRTKTRLDSLSRNTLIKYPPAHACVCVCVCAPLIAVRTQRWPRSALMVLNCCPALIGKRRFSQSRRTGGSCQELWLRTISLRVEGRKQSRMTLERRRWWKQGFSGGRSSRPRPAAVKLSVNQERHQHTSTPRTCWTLLPQGLSQGAVLHVDLGGFWSVTAHMMGN